ncbi:amidohydrolase/deacetylase family metallohydrolase [Paenibacillus glycanilyticus]|uniref:Dihydroorotase n=1 Tax=Paenibacillus glycanilyticus TaxID=126569 RepID=A0ABQ6GJE7_9BACL|nr:amidohydrolase/deacetylase family metallohydrolase [Paenibacillus glycanilyticus]GLX69752.1 dihydroorotase [Paenibacillus glycanilyticus]
MKEQRYVLRNLKLVDERQIDITINNGWIERIAETGKPRSASEVHRESERLAELDGAGLYVSSGWIDMHVHAFSELEPYGDEIDAIGVEQGVTTIVDAGSCGADRIGELLASARAAQTKLLAFLNISHIGLLRVDELSELSWINRDKLLHAVREYGEYIVGLKARISRSVVKELGIEPLRLARSFSEETGLPLMVHIGSGPPAIEEVVELLASKDIITHYLNGKSNNLFGQDDEPLPVLLDALGRGVRLDVGHGTASFSFKVAEAATRHGIPLHTISTDIYRSNRVNGPVYSLANVMTKFLYLGYTLEQVVAAVTSTAADWLGRPELGRIEVGDPANLTLFEVREEQVQLVDSEGNERMANQHIQAKGVVVDGKFIACELRS